MSASLTTADSPAIAIDYAAVLLQTLAASNIGSDDALKGTGIQLQELEQTDAFISQVQFRQLVANALKLSADDALGLHFGQQLNINTHGFLGYAIMSSASPLHALEMSMKYLRIRNRLVTLKVTTEDNLATLTFDTQVEDGAFKRFLIEHAFSSLQTVMQFLHSEVLTVKSFSFDYAAPQYSAQYEQVLKTAASFSAPTNCVVLQANDLSNSSLLADERLAQIAQQQCEDMLARLNEEQSLTKRIETLLRQTPGQFPNAELMAQQVGLSGRTLSRQLKAEDTSYKVIVDDIKRSMAMDYLRTTDWSVDEIAYLLNYSDPSNFARAFKKWSGLSPKQFREEKG